MVIRSLQLKNTTAVLLEQLCNTAWNFFLGAIIARLGNLEIFSLYATTLAVTYFVALPLNGMTVGIISVDAARLKKARQSYIRHSVGSADTITVLLALTVFITVLYVTSISDADYKYAIGLVAGAYAVNTIFSDIWRRLIILNGDVRKVLALSFCRIVSLIGLSVCLIVMIDQHYQSYYLGIGALCISMLFSVSLRVVLGIHAKRSIKRSTISLKRIMRFGSWAFASALLMTVFDQGILIYAGYLGHHQVAGEVRSAAYLFGVLNPILLVFDLLAPSIVAKIFGRVITLGMLVPYLISVMVVAGSISLFVSYFSANYWLPFLGDSYADLAPLSYWAGAAFSCIMIRTSVMPFLKTRTPRLLFLSSAAGAVTGFTSVFLSGSLSSLSVSIAIFSSACVLMILSAGILLGIVLSGSTHARAVGGANL